MTVKIEKKSDLDRFDWKILEIVALDGRIAVTELARKLGMSTTPCAVRLKRLIESNYILGFRALLNPQKLDLTHVAFVEVKLHDTTETALNAFNQAVTSVPEIEQAHMIAGPFDYLLKVRTTNIQSYRKVLGERISTLPYVASSSTYVSMEAIKEGGLAGG